MTLAEIYAIAPAYVWFGALVVGLSIGSFLNVVILRLPVIMYREWESDHKDYIKSKEEAKIPADVEAFLHLEHYNLAVPSSTCPKCKAQIKPWHNIPVFGYFLLAGKCANCSAPISIRYPIVELITGLLTCYVFMFFGASVQAFCAVILLWSLISLTMIDADHQLLPDKITLPLIWLGLIVNLFGVFTSIESAVIGAIAGYLSLRLVYEGFKLLTKKEGMGFGDFKLLAALGAWLGWEQLPLIIMLSSFIGAIVGISWMVITKQKQSTPLPFGPYLASAGLVSLFWGADIITAYIDFSNLSSAGL